MPKLTPEAWEGLRARREAGASLGELSRLFEIDKSRISRRARKEGWATPAEAAATIRQRVHKKVNLDEIKKAQAIEAASDQAAEIIKLHRAEWAGHRGLFPLKDLAQDFNLGKVAKISCEMIALRQKAERAAWGLDTPEGEDGEIEIQIVRSWGLQG